MAVTQQQVAEVYVATFNRAPDAAGLAYWVNDSFGGNPTIEQIAASFFDQSETQALYPEGTTDEAFVTSIYQNLFNRAPDADGLAYWTGESGLGGAMTRDVMIEAMKNGATGDDATIIANKAEVGLYYASAGLDGTYSLASVTADTATVTAAKAEVDTLDPSTFTLTTGTDAVADFTGTASDDTFVGVNSSLLAEGTLQVKDAMDGGDGTDTAKFSMKQNFDGFTTGSMANVEKVELTNDTTTDLTFKATGITGANSYTVNSTNGLITLSELSELASLDVTGPVGTKTFSAGYSTTSTVTTGTQTDTQVMKVTNVGTVDSDGVGGTATAKYMTIDIDKVEALQLTTAGTANSVDLSASADIATITLAGEGTTEINAVGTAVTSFDASAATGDVIATLSGAQTNKLATVKGGSANDTITVALDDLTASATIAGGDGTDTLSVSGSGTKTLQAAMTGFETLEFAAPASVTGAVTFSGTNVTGIENLNFKAGALGANVSLVNMGSNNLTVNTTGAVTGNTVSADNTGAVTLNMNGATGSTTQVNTKTGFTFGSASTATINVNDYVKYDTGAISTGAATLNLNVASEVKNSAEQTVFNAGITAAKATAINVDATGELGTSAQITAAEAKTATIKTGSTSTTNTLDLDTAKLTTLDITAAGNLDLVTSTLNKVQSFTATTSGLLDLSDNAATLNDAATVVVSGTGTKSAVNFKSLGTTTLTHNVSLTASGMKAGVTAGAIDAGSAAVAIDVSSVTGDVTLSTIDGDAGITLNAKSLGGNLSNGAGALKTTTGDISIDVSAATGTTTLGALTSTGNKGDVSIDASASVGAVTVGVISGDNVTVKGTNALGAVKVNNVSTADGTKDAEAKTSFTYEGTNLFDNGLDVHTSSDSKAFTASLTGGAKNEVIQIDSKSAVQESITVSGDLGGGTNSVKVVLADNTGSAATDAQTVNLSGLTSSATVNDATYETETDISLEIDSAITYTGSVKDDKVVYTAASGAAVITNSNAVSLSDTTLTDGDIFTIDANAESVVFGNVSLTGVESLNIAASSSATTAQIVTAVADKDSVYLNASAVSGKAIAVSGASANDDLFLTGTDGTDVVDLSKLTDGGADLDIATYLGKGNDTFKASALIDTFVFAAAADNGTDSISSFTAGTDKLGVSTTGTIVGSASGAIDVDDDAASGAKLDTAVSEIGQISDNAAADWSDVMTVIGNAVTIAADTTAGNAASIILIDNGTDTRVYHFSDDATSNATIESTEITLLGTLYNVGDATTVDNYV